MRHFTTAKDDHDFYAVAIFEETVDFTEFYIKVIVANFEADFHLLKLGLFFAGFFAIFRLFFHLLVLELSPIDYSNDGRVSIGSDFYEINALLTGEREGIAAGH